MRKLIIFSTFCILTANFAQAELVQQFKDPTFSGNGWTTQVLTLEQMRQSAVQQRDAKIAADAANAAAAAANTPLAKFMSLFTGQVYSQLATQLTNNLFNSCTKVNPSDCTSGNFNVSDTQQISWIKSGTNVTLNVFSGKANPDGTFTRSSSTPDQSIVVPISSFAF